MADDRVEYVITIRTEGAAAESWSNSSIGGVSKTKDGEDVSGVGSFTAKNAAAFGVAAAKKITDTVVTTYLNRVDITTGNSTLAQKLSYQYSEMQRSIAIGTALIGGIATGNVPAVIGGVAAIASRLVDISIARRDLELQRSLEDISIRQANIRAGAGGDRAGRNTY